MHVLSINDPQSIEKAAEVLTTGGVIVYPTDTAYGLGVDATNAEAVQKIVAIKERDEGKPIPVIVGDAKQAKRCVLFSDSAEKLTAAFWPGPLTLVLPARDAVVAETVHGNGTIGLRVPDVLWCRLLALKLGRPITSTSANTTGTPPEYSLEDVRASLADRADLVDVWIDGGTLAGGPVSTIVRLVGKCEIQREGAISRGDIEKMLQ